MTKKSPNIAEISAKVLPWIFVLLFLLSWQLITIVFKIKVWLLPPPSAIFLSLINSIDLILLHTGRTVFEAILGLVISLVVGVLTAFLLEWSQSLKRIIYPFLLFTQTVPFITIAPLLAVWFGYGLTAKIIIVALVCFFPIAVNVELGLSSIDRNYIRLMESMGATKWQVFKLAKFPSSLPFLFTGLRIAASYSLLTAVISEWIGTDKGLGILLMRSAKSYLTDRAFAVVFVISLLSLVLVKIVDYLAFISIPWNYKKLSAERMG